MIYGVFGNDYRAAVDYNGNIVHNSLIYAGVSSSLFTFDIFDLGTVRVKQNLSLAVIVTDM
jgi:hypothetical protein